MVISTHHIIPEDERYCIWMDAGVVDYKLCNCLFKCEDCSFDAQIRMRNGSQHAAASRVERAIVTPGRIESSASAEAQGASAMRNLLGSITARELPDDRLYSQNHTWAKAEEQGTFVLGIDHFVGTMLSSAHSVAFSVPPTHINASEPYAWIVANGETLAVCSPIAGTIVENNAALASSSTVIHADPYGRGWIARIKPDGFAAARTLRGHDDMAKVMETDRIRYEREIHSELRRMQPQSSATMYDGGTLLGNFEDILGTKKYYEILERFLRP